LRGGTFRYLGGSLRGDATIAIQPFPDSDIQTRWGLVLRDNEADVKFTPALVYAGLFLAWLCLSLHTGVLQSEFGRYQDW
jgi:hypothetical protein